MQLADVLDAVFYTWPSSVDIWQKKGESLAFVPFSISLHRGAILTSS